jgi:(5-formylfuran-3-yl)methyl phosphate synthase
MRLLVSVRCAEEAVAAADGGADVIDAKDPMAGALGAVGLDVLREIRAAVPARRLVTAALGDADNAAAIERLAREYAASGASFVKVGFAGIADANRVAELIAACVRGCESGNSESGVIAVAYADALPRASVDAMLLPSIAAHAGARGVLVDTADKDGVGLTTLWPRDRLAEWVARARDYALLVAVAGKLSVDDLAIASAAGADIAGVRGAACIGGRGGRVSVDRVRDLVAAQLAAQGRTVSRSAETSASLESAATIAADTPGGSERAKHGSTAASMAAPGGFTSTS